MQAKNDLILNKKHVEKLIERAADSMDSAEAMKFAQAACNAANAMCSLRAALAD